MDTYIKYACIKVWIYYKWELCFFKIRVRVRDDGTPFKYNITTVAVTVERNFADPQWGVSRYSKAINESATLGTSILQVSAKDRDRKVRL